MFSKIGERWLGEIREVIVSLSYGVEIGTGWIWLTHQSMLKADR